MFAKHATLAMKPAHFASVGAKSDLPRIRANSLIRSGHARVKAGWPASLLLKKQGSRRILLLLEQQVTAPELGFHAS
jgi:hypothetical protein